MDWDIQLLKHVHDKERNVRAKVFCKTLSRVHENRFQSLRVFKFENNGDYVDTKAREYNGQEQKTFPYLYLMSLVLLMSVLLLPPLQLWPP